MTEAAADAVAAPFAGETSLQARLRASHAREVKRVTGEFEIAPGVFDPPLWGVFRALDDYSERRQAAFRHQNVADDAERELLGAADAIVTACEDVYALVDGEKVSLGVRIGKPLADYLGIPADNDRQAIFALFKRGTMQIGDLFADIVTLSSRAADKATEVDAGNS